MNRNQNVTFALGMFALFAASVAKAQLTYTYYTADTTINTPVTTTYAIVGYSGRNATSFIGPASPTVGLADGGNVFYIGVFNRSALNMMGGYVDYLYAYNNSVVNINGGNPGYLYAYDNSAFNISGGNVTNLYAYNSGTVSVSGGNVYGNLGALDSSAINMSGGNVAYLYASYNSTANVYGGSIDFLTAYGSGSVNFSGGNIGSLIDAHDNSTINIYGINLTDTPFEQGIGLYGPYTLYYINGLLADGTILNNMELDLYGNAKFNLIHASAAPEPGGVALFVGVVTAGAEMLRRRRQ